ncbi:MAG: S8 family serine peptidase [Bacteroidetes bacterium]|nr:S8 family serine peptidase [Bacteroidota bacterium]
MVSQFFKLLLIFILFAVSSNNAQNNSQVQIPLKGTGVEDFLIKNPKFDGDGTIIIVIDTGIDIGIDGLTKTPDGKNKVIDVQDFTLQGDIPFYEAEIDDEDGIEFFINEDNNFKVNGAGNLALKAADDKYFIGNFSEKLLMNSNSVVSDINNNGKDDDNFYFVTFNVIENQNSYWVLYIDRNADGNLSDEKPLRNYKENFDSFSIPNGIDLPDLTIAVNIFPNDKKVNFFFDDGGHGTHCAGIATGFNIGENNINGVAPGAKLIGLKIGHNSLGSGTVNGSMKNAFLYADKISKERNEPCIINLSYGIGSELEGLSEMEKFLENLILENPYLYIAKSNGNDGPGISTAGLPCNLNSVLSVGAVLTKEVGNNFYGTTLNRDIILHFSSRGAEYTKPDITAPGACVSTVPNYDNNDISWGTSMSSPYAAGVMSLLLSAAQKEFPDVKIKSHFLYKVIRESAVKWEKYSHVDEGAGYINVVNAYELLKKYIKNGELNNYETYSISSFAPHMPNNKAPNLYIRNGNYLNGNEKFKFTVKRDNFIKKDKFYRLFNIKSDSDWLNPSQSKSHIRNDQQLTIDVMLDKTKMKNPGLYNGMIYGTRDDKTNTPEFEMMATVVIPYEFNSTNNFMLKWENEKLEPGMHKRYFLNVPAGTSNLRIKITSGINKFTNVRYYLHDQVGRQKSFGLCNISYSDEYYEKHIYPIEPGVYELVVLANYNSGDTSEFDLMVDFDAINKVGSNLVSLGNNSLSVINLFNEVKSYSLKCDILGYQKDYDIQINKVRSYDMPFSLKKGEYLKKFTVTMLKEDFNKITDFSLLIFDENGKKEEIVSFSYFETEISITNSSLNEEKKYLLKIVPGFTNENEAISLKIREETFVEKPQSIKIVPASLSFYPTMETHLNLNIEKPVFEKPGDSKYFGKIDFKSKTGTEYEMPLLINNGEAK